MGTEGSVMFLVDARVIEAHSVGIERRFYEDENGEIRWGRSSEIEEHHLLVQPDVTFFDANGNPILFIEIVATHGVNVEKRLKHKRLGIDTIQVTISKGSPEEIEASLMKTDRIKWIYNNDQERTKYVPTSSSATAGVLPIDELQRELFEETLACREAQINNLIRSITKCLGSEPYRQSEEGLRSEISRVARNTAEHKRRFQQLKESNREAVIAEHQPRRNRIRGEQEELSRIKAELEREAADIEQRISQIKSYQRREGNPFEEQERTIEREAADVEGFIEQEAAGIDQIQRNRENLPERFRIQDESTEARFKRLEETERAEIGSIEQRRNDLPGRTERSKAELRSRIEELRRDADKIVELIQERNLYYPLIILTSNETDALDHIENVNLINGKDMLSSEGDNSKKDILKHMMKTLLLHLMSARMRISRRIL
ncbi:MAG: hypothetical protein EOP48_23495 [Sphingobacteriales bacterium]|nr:MAG: hypothetical protein EOP48_23495 [Sphingobacteriales bacterium]